MAPVVRASARPQSRRHHVLEREQAGPGAAGRRLCGLDEALVEVKRARLVEGQVMPGGDLGSERAAQERGRRLDQRRGAARLQDLEATVREQAPQRPPREEAQVGAIVEPRVTVVEAAREGREAVVPDRVVRDRHEPGGRAETPLRGHLAQELDGLDLVLHDVAEQHRVEGTGGRGPVRHRPLEHLVASNARQLGGCGIRLDAHEVAVGNPTADRSRVGPRTAPDIEHHGRRPMPHHTPLEERQQRLIGALDVGVLTGPVVERIAVFAVHAAWVIPRPMPRKHPTDDLNPALVSALGRPRTVLDVGCGAGVAALAAQQRGAEVVALERDPEPLERARRVLPEVITADFDEPDALQRAVGERQFDLVILPDALERSRDPAALVARCADFVAPEGRLVASVRNREAWPLRWQLASPEIGYDDPHRVLLKRRDVVGMTRAAGLEVLEVAQNPMLLKAGRGLLDEAFDLTLRDGEESATGFRDLSTYQLYLTAVRPLEVQLAHLAPRLLAYQHVVVARKRPQPGPLSLTVGMLTMDEEPSIARMMGEIRKVAPDAKVLCVDSSVKDRTPEIAQEHGARVLRQLPPRGHGPAMELLMYEAARQSDALIYLDCDFTYPPEVIPAIRQILAGGADVVNAARTRTKPDAMPLANYVANKTFVAAARALNGMPVADLHSGMRGYRSSVIRSFDFDGEGDAIPIDTLLWPARCGYRVVEVPIEYQERVGFSKLRKLTGTVWTFIRLARTLNVGTRRDDTYQVWNRLDAED